MEEEEFFTGNKKSLYLYWQNKERAQKFLTGGTRTRMVIDVLQGDHKFIRERNWLDVGGGPGFVQSKIEEHIYRMVVILDISLEGLRLHQNPSSQKINGSFTDLPFRRGSFGVISSFFCLSDYPRLIEVIKHLLTIAEDGGRFILVDYAKGDEYWEMRKKQNNPKLIGNINLRSTEYISQEVYKEEGFFIELAEEKEYEMESKELRNSLPLLPQFLKRKFLHIVIRKEK